MLLHALRQKVPLTGPIATLNDHIGAFDKHVPPFEVHLHCMQTGGSSDTGEVSPGAGDSASAHDDDSRAEHGNEEEDAEANHEEKKLKGPKGKLRPSLKALAKHRRQRLRELQAEQELEANLGTSTGETAVPAFYSDLR